MSIKMIKNIFIFKIQIRIWVIVIQKGVLAEKCREMDFWKLFDSIKDGMELFWVQWEQGMLDFTTLLIIPTQLRSSIPTHINWVFSSRYWQDTNLHSVYKYENGLLSSCNSTIQKQNLFLFYLPSLTTIYH